MIVEPFPKPRPGNVGTGAGADQKPMANEIGKALGLPHLNVEDMDFVEGKWRKRKDERRGLV